MKNLSRILSVVAWLTAIVIAWTERRTAQESPTNPYASPGPEASPTSAEAGGGTERAASSASQGTATPSGAPPDSGPAPVLTDMPSASEPTQTPAANIETTTADVGILAVRDPAGDPEVEEILGGPSLQDDETVDAASAIVNGPSAPVSNDAAGAPRGDQQGPGGTSAPPTGGEAAGPANSVPGTGTAACPDGYPVKGNASSRIFHLPGESSYDRTVPEICFATAEDATAAGFRPRKH